jgi:hypothetical protein
MRPQRTPFAFTITVGDLERDWTLSLQARERLLTEFAAYGGWSASELRAHLDSLHLNERER